MAGDTRGRGRAHADPRRDGPEPARDAGRRRAQRAADAPDRPRAAARAARRGRAAAGAAPRGRRALRPGQGARRHRALPDDRARGARPRGPRVRLLPHGHRQPPGRAAPPTATSEPSYAQVYFDSTPARHPAVQRRLAAFGDDSSNYLWKLYAAREIMRLHREDPRRSSRGCEQLQARRTRPRRCCTRPRRRRASATPDGAARRVGRGRDPRVPGRPGAHRAGARRAHGRAGAADRRRPRPLPRAAARGARDGALHRRADARVRRRRRAARRHLDGARRAVPAPARARQPRGDAQLLAAHDRLGVRRRARLPLAAPGARVPVRARPAAGART